MERARTVSVVVSIHIATPNIVIVRGIVWGRFWELSTSWCMIFSSTTEHVVPAIQSNRISLE